MTRKEIEEQIAEHERQILELKILHKETDNPSYPDKIFDNKKKLTELNLFWVKSKKESIKPFGEIQSICKAIRMAMFKSTDGYNLTKVADMNSKQYRAYVDALDKFLMVLESLAKGEF